MKHLDRRRLSIGESASGVLRVIPSLWACQRSRWSAEGALLPNLLLGGRVVASGVDAAAVVNIPTLVTTLSRSRSGSVVATF